MSKLFLAPMEGVIDWIMRDQLTKIGGIDHCVTEFCRVTHHLHSDKIFYDYCPELKTLSRTSSGTPVYFQLLGSDPHYMAANALRASELGAIGIDLNFGCPAKTVNRHDGGAALLKTPERIYKIVDQVRKAVPSHIPVTAKIRLGFDDPSLCLENAQATESGGAEWLVVHCRTKTDGYRPPAYWEWIPKIKEKTKIEIIANGEVWNVSDYERCREVTGCENVMIGRAALSNPFVFNEIKNKTEHLMSWSAIKTHLQIFFENCENKVSGPFAVSRTKQWLSQISTQIPEAKLAFDQLKVLKKPEEFRVMLFSNI